MKNTISTSIVGNSSILVTGPTVGRIVRQLRAFGDKFDTTCENGKITVGYAINKTRLADNIVTKAEYYEDDIQFGRLGNATVCVLQKDGYTRVGVAICSPDDEYSYTIGKAISYLRAAKMAIPGELLL